MSKVKVTSVKYDFGHLTNLLNLTYDVMSSYDVKG